MKTTIDKHDFRREFEEYDQQAKDFIDATGLTIDKQYIGHIDKFNTGTPTAVYQITFKRKGWKDYNFQFSTSIANSYKKTLRGNKVQTHKRPSDYDILACLDVFDGDFEWFCSSFGYDTDSRKALEIYLEVEKQTTSLQRMFTLEELEQLQEIV